MFDEGTIDGTHMNLVIFEGKMMSIPSFMSKYPKYTNITKETMVCCDDAEDVRRSAEDAHNITTPIPSDVSFCQVFVVNGIDDIHLFKYVICTVG